MAPDKNHRLIYLAAAATVVGGAVAVVLMFHSPWVGVLVGGALVVEALLLSRKRRRP